MIGPSCQGSAIRVLAALRAVLAHYEGLPYRNALRRALRAEIERLEVEEG